jgi:hypothetical protein
MRDLGVLSSLALLVVGAAGTARGAEPAPSSLTMQAVGTAGATVSGASQFGVAGDTSVDVAVARRSGGQVRVVSGPGGSFPGAVDFPAYVASGTYPRAVLRVTPTSGAALSPGADDFEYGAVLRLDAVSSGRSIDDGDNVFQRGLYVDSAQFKLQVDHRRPSCLVRGSAGRVFVRSATRLTADKWYVVKCARVGSRLSVRVVAYGSSSTPARAVAYGRSGTLRFPSSRSAAIGGKLTSEGAVVPRATDQLNGAVARVWVRRLPVGTSAN